MYEILEGDCLEELDKLDKQSVDCIITDPPYEISFMGKDWDKTGVSMDKEMWAKCLRVLKPGGYLLSFGGARTFHRIGCAIEDAGFEIRDCISWLYGCYSEDTQVLTDSGWRYFYELDKTERVLQWDKSTNKLSWVKPLNYFEYDISEEMRLFENRHISQLVTKNHKIAVSVKRRRREYEPYELVVANDIQKSWALKFPLAGELDGEVHEKDAYIIGWWLTDAWKHRDGKAVMFSQSKPRTLTKLRRWFDDNKIRYSEYVKDRVSKNKNHQDEHTFYIVGELADKLLSEWYKREITWDVLNWDKESRLLLLEGLMDGDGSCREGGYSNIFWSQKQERCDIVQALCLSLNFRAYLYYKHGRISGVVFNTAHNSTETQKRHRKPNVLYKGKVYCLETETGAFVVRRNGKAFISGNSGMPKALDIGLAVDKRRSCNNAKREANNEWKGWKSAFKPSWEPILVARKPFKGTLVDNVLTRGVGGLNIDECRVGEEVRGRYPANTILTYDESDFNEVCGGLPYTKGGGKVKKKGAYGYCFSEGKRSDKPMADGYDDSGSAARYFKNCKYDRENLELRRYFYSAKASRKDREEGLEDFEKKQVYGEANVPWGYGNANGDNFGDRIANVKRANIHPSVKPTELMRYLVRLVAPKGAVILDPFMGSGSTGKAVMLENKERDKGYKFIGIEQEHEYCEIAKARIEFAMK